MADIYDDLENYNDVNLIYEIQNENKELKIKLEESKLALAKLQKVFDKLSLDYKNLEANYSSLMKTAKAEIERKTQAIANINMEKDMLVLNCIQNSNKSVLVLRRHMDQERSNNRMCRNDDIESAKMNKKDMQEVKRDPERTRNDENRLPSIDTTSSGNTNDSNNIIKIENKSGKLDAYDKTSASKENTAKGKKALSLKQRRKSMPVLNKQAANCSSDEEFEGHCSDDVKRERFPREEKSRKYFDRHKISETSGIDEKYSSYHESSRETYYKGKPHRPMDKFRSIKDKSRFRKHYSPEKVRRPTRDYREDERQDLFRHNRVLVSPPRERVNPLRMFRDRRSNHERDRSLEERRSRRDDLDDRMRKDDFHEDRPKQREDYRQGWQRHGFHEERQRSRTRSDERRGTSHEERFRQRCEGFEESKSRDSSLVSRHQPNDELNREEENDEVREEKQKKPSKLTVKEERKSRRRCRQSDNDEPSNKRARTDSFKTTDEVVKCREETNIAQEKLFPEFAPHLQSFSCQSPDDPYHETHPLVAPSSAQPKEIMTTSSSYVEDPRLVSKKYKQRVLGDKIVLETVTGRNVNLVAVDISKWNDKPQVKAPASLQKPPEFSDEMVQEVYMNIDNPILNSSLELGEIQSESNDGRMVDYLSKNFNQDYENERIKQLEARADKEIVNIKHKRETVIKQDLHTNDSDYLSKNLNQDYENERTKQIEARPDKEIANIKHKRETKIKRDLHTNDSEQSNKLVSEPKLSPVKYKLRPSNPQPNQDPVPNPLGILFKQLVPSCDIDPPSKSPGGKLDVDATFGTDDDDSQDKNLEIKTVKPTDVRNLRGRTISAQELVEGDLALSDETCDNVFMQRQKRKQKLKEKVDSGKIERERENQKTDLEQKTAKSVAKLDEKKPRKTKAALKVTDQIEEECKATETKTLTDYKIVKKTRKKPSPKQKTLSAKETPKTEDLVLNTERTPRTYKGKKSKSPLVTKDENQGNKFTELFGDSSSLMTPEDLGMVTQTQSELMEKYVPICEDAQDSVDVNVTASKNKEIMTTNPPVTSSKIEEPATPIEVTPKSLICKISLPSKSVSKINKMDNATIAASVKKLTPDMEVSNEEITKDIDVVKTVIISTGVQPKLEEIETNINVSDKNANSAKTTDTVVHEPAIPIALATSTPHKRLLLQLEAQVECNSSSSSNEVQKDTLPVDQSSASNGLSSDVQNDDTPDVRIIVRRRRRLKQ